MSKSQITWENEGNSQEPNWHAFSLDLGKIRLFLSRHVFSKVEAGESQPDWYLQIQFQTESQTAYRVELPGALSTQEAQLASRMRAIEALTDARDELHWTFREYEKRTRRHLEEFQTAIGLCRQLPRASGSPTADSLRQHVVTLTVKDFEQPYFAEVRTRARSRADAEDRAMSRDPATLVWKNRRGRKVAWKKIKYGMVTVVLP